MTAGNKRPHTYTVAPAIGGRKVLAAAVDRQAGAVTVTFPDGRSLTVDVTEAAALGLTFTAMRGRSLDLDAGPSLRVSHSTGNGAVLCLDLGPL